MPNEYKIQISKLAILDIENIFEYTVERWSLDQAEEYYSLLLSEIDSLSTNPTIGKSIPEIKENHRCKIVRAHYIIYRVEKEVIYIDRILHQRMNITEILNE